MEQNEMTEFVEALRGLKAAVIDLKAVVYDTNMKLSKALNDSHIPSAMRMLDNSFEFRSMLDNAKK